MKSALLALCLSAVAALCLAAYPFVQIDGGDILLSGERIQFAAGGGGETPWYLAGGVAASNCVGAWQAKGAASLAASYTNLANPGTYTLSVGSAPGWNSATGWVFGGSTYLRTGVAPAAGWSMVAFYTNTSAGNAQCVMGSVNATPNRFNLYPRGGSTVAVWGYDGNYSADSAYDHGVMALAASAAYHNGVYLGATSPNSTPGAIPIYIGVRNNNNFAPDGYYNGHVIAVALYSTTLTSNQVLQISNAMRSL